MGTIKVFYHKSDFDGICSAAIIKEKFPEAHLFPIDYGDLFPFNKIKKEDRVFVVDFCLQPFENMIKLYSMCDMVWIDHHISAIKEYDTWLSKQENNPLNVSWKGVRAIGTGACKLVWWFIHPKETPTPTSVNLISLYDIWDHTNPNVLPFQYGLKAEAPTTTDPNHIVFWSSLFYDISATLNIVNNGKTIMKYVESDNERIAKHQCFETKFEGWNILACNRYSNSQLFDSVFDKEKHDIMITFYRSPTKKWTVSLFTTKPEIDVSIIAKKYGGGGHGGAAGFNCVVLPFEI